MARTERRPTTNPKPWLNYFIRVPYRILAHEAFLTLRPTAQMVYLDFRRHMDRHTEFGTRDVPKNGIPYSYGHCAHLCHRNSFRIAMLDLEERGFVQDTGQIDADIEVRWYIPRTKWRSWRAPEKDAKRVAAMKQRILRREQKDGTDKCTFFVQQRPQILDNPLLKFWTDPALNCTKKVQSLHTDQIRDDPEHAGAHAKQKEYQEPPHQPKHTAEEAIASLAAWRAEQRRKREAAQRRDADAIEATRAFPREQ